LVLAQPDRAFSIRAEGRTVLDVPGVPAPLARVAQVYGERFAQRLAVVELREPGLELHGLFGPPELSRPTRTDQFFFLLGRPVQPGGLLAAIYQVYGRYLGRGQHPAFFLYLDVDPGLVDVNVHPKKEEVRFRAEGLVMDLLRRATMRALGGGVAICPPAARPGPAWAPPPPPAPQAQPGPLFAPGAATRPWRVLGQARASFIVVETEQGLELVDQHASHERVLYETYRDGAEVRVQEFLIPVQVEVPFDRAEALRAALPRLRELGVVLEPFGDQGFLLRGWPAPLADRQTRLGFQAPLLEVAESLLEGEPPLLELWRAIACAAAIKAGETLSQEEQEALIAQWKGTKEPGRCPHGRPVAVQLTWEELARKVGR
jgi:DNA mismatch repair protein MutL